MKKLSRGFNRKGQDVTESSAVSSTMLDNIEEELARDGIVPFDNKNILSEYLRLPPDLTEETSKELGKFFNSFTQQKMFVRTTLGRTGAVLRELNDKIDGIRESVYRELPTKMSIKEKELAVRGQGQATLDLMNEISRLEEKKKMLADYLESLSDALFGISREVSRRTSDWADDKRDSNISNERRK